MSADSSRRFDDEEDYKKEGISNNLN